MVIYLKPGTRWKIASALTLVLILLGARVGLSLQSRNEEAAARIVPLSHVNTGLPVVGLMVDVSQARPEQIQAALLVLGSLQMKGTWFVDATTVESQPALMKDIASKGHELGLGGTDDKPIDRLSRAEVKDRVLRSRQALAKVGIEPVPFLFPPLGRFSDTVITVALQEGCQAVRPVYDASVMRGKEDAAAAKIANAVMPGDILVAKVGKSGILPEQRYLAALVGSLKERGLALAPLSDLVKGVK